MLKESFPAEFQGSITPILNLDSDSQRVTVDDLSPTISVLWDRAVQQAVTDLSPGPTIASRAYSMVHTAIFDAWAAYDLKAISTQLGDELQRPEGEITEDNKIEAMSYAAYRVLSVLFPTQVEIFAQLMLELGFNPRKYTTDTSTAAGIGNVSAEKLLEFRAEDGSNQLGNAPNGTPSVPYSDPSGYKSVYDLGEPLELERWSPELVPIDAEPGTEKYLQKFLTPHWGDVEPFALESGDEFRPEAPQPFLLVDGEVDLKAKTITLSETDEVLPISKELIGEVINPQFIAQAEQLIDVSANLTDEQKLIAEFWEDGGGTSFPPGTWMTFGEFVSARDDNTLDEDAKLFFALGNAVFDAGVATWEAKRYYDYVRPVRAIRELGELGLIGEFNEELGGYAIEAWSGPGRGTQTILVSDFLTYQTPGSDPSPPFAEYTSGHSAFSAAAAQILKSFTESDDFGTSVTFEPGQSRFEPEITPEEALTLEWETFSEAADEAGISRIYGGIHFEEGDLNGRLLGREVGEAVWEQVQFYIEGGEAEAEILDSSNLLDGVIDLSDSEARTVTFTVSREAYFDNTVGYYIATADGSVIDPVSGDSISPGEAGYKQVALANSLEFTLTVKNNTSVDLVTQLDGGSIFAPFIVVNGSIADADEREVYFAFEAANSDGVKHVRSLGDNTFGFEDLPNGGDLDFNDLVIEVKLT